MGTITKRATITGRTLQEAFKKLQDECREEYGEDIYNGQWNNCSEVREVSAKEFDRCDDMNKHEPAIAKCIRKPTTNTNKIKTVVTNYPATGTRKWVTRYRATSYRNNYAEMVVDEPTQGAAIKKARAWVEKFPDDYLTVHIAKVLEGQKTMVAKIDYKKANNERNGAWEIFGAMSY
jgi:hypothetical protein